MKKFIVTILILHLGSFSFAQTYNERVSTYVNTYKDWAIAEQQRTGIPASITLAQGVLETGAGNSVLATEANNHFGIKCRKEWTGLTYAYTDDAPNECFRKYEKAYDSYKDHSDYLMSGSRYQSCFAQSVTDYAAWAHQLKKCGYATNPLYAQRLIKIIEDYKLQEYTYAALEKPKSNAIQLAGEIVPEMELMPENPKPVTVPGKEAEKIVTLANESPATEPVMDMNATTNQAQPAIASITYGTQSQKNGLNGFYARKGDVLLEYAIQYNMRYARMLELNDLPDAPLEADMFIYLEKKRSRGNRIIHIVLPGETMVQIAQAEGMQLRQLQQLNQMEVNEEVQSGNALYLQQYAPSKPSVRLVNSKIIKQSIPAPTPAAGYVSTNRAQQEKVQSSSSATTDVDVRSADKVTHKTQENTTTPQAQVPAIVKTDHPDGEGDRIVSTTKTETQKVENAVAVRTPVQQPARQQAVPKQSTATFNIANEKAIGEGKPHARFVEPKEQIATAPSVIAAKETQGSMDRLLSTQEKIVATTAAEVAIIPEPIPAPQVPMSDFDKLKLKLDQMVYSTPAVSSAASSTKVSPLPTVKTASPTVNEAQKQIVNASESYYLVKQGDTAYGIAKMHGMGTQKLMSMNNLQDFQALKPGQKLKVK